LIDEACSKVRLESLTPPEEIKEMENRLTAICGEKEMAVNQQDFERAAKLRDEEKELQQELNSQKAKWQSSAPQHDLSVTETEIAEIVSG
jgi:ATP-dependent Clp protease ATP-binding subunit ClpC